MAIFVSVMLWAASLAADMASEDPGPPAPHPRNPDCVSSNPVLEGFDCKECRYPQEFDVEPSDCDPDWEDRGYYLACGDGWNELWCCSLTRAFDCSALVEVPFIDPPPEDDHVDEDDPSCAVSRGSRSQLPAKLGLVAALIGLGLFVRWRSRD